MMTLSTEQNTALEQMMAFIFDDENDVFILRGGAGSGKTSVIARLALELDFLEAPFQMMAPTGRAARVLTNKLNEQYKGRSMRIAAKTIHSVVYEYSHIEKAENGFSIVTYYDIKQGNPQETVFIIDEASMIGDLTKEPGNIVFGTTQLIKDIFTFSKKNEQDKPVKIIFVGDDAQLMPIKENLSPALSADYLREVYGKQVQEFKLTTIFRQDEQNSVLKNALQLRNSIEQETFRCFELEEKESELSAVSANDIVTLAAESYAQNYSCIVIAHSNKQVLGYNAGIRSLLWKNPEEMQLGDRLVVQQNSSIFPLLNGDIVTIAEILDETQVVRISLRKFGDVELCFRRLKVAYEDDFGGSTDVQEVVILENLLYSEQATLGFKEKMALEAYFSIRHKRSKYEKDEYEQLYRTDPYLNVLQVKYGYAITCHKAQGGEWDKVFVDFNYRGPLQSAGFYRWAYTALTRASNQVYAANTPVITPEYAYTPAFDGWF